MHEPVLCAEAIAALEPQRGGVFIDATFGAGGHSRAILAALPAPGRLLAVDCDPIASELAEGIEDPRFAFARGNFGNLAELAAGEGIQEAAGVLMDLGMSSMQLAHPERGFSFAADGPLDMRLDPDNGLPLARWLRKATEREIGSVIRRYGQERSWRIIAKAIAARRKARRLAGTADLAEACLDAFGGKRGSIHPATRTFQAFRIYSNRELERLAAGLAAATGLLARGGRLAVISFHSLEDGIVRDFMTRRSGSPIELRRLIRLARPSEAEISRNPRARSGRLRVAERT